MAALLPLGLARGRRSSPCSCSPTPPSRASSSRSARARPSRPSSCSSRCFPAPARASCRSASPRASCSANLADHVPRRAPSSARSLAARRAPGTRSAPRSCSSSPGEPAPALVGWPVYVAALAAQFAFDFVSAAGARVARARRLAAPQLARSWPGSTSSTPRSRRSGCSPRRGASSHATPSCSCCRSPPCSPSSPASGGRGIDHALELAHAYRGTALLLGDVVEADDAYTGSHSRDVVELVARGGRRAGARRPRAARRRVRGAAARRRQDPRSRTRSSTSRARSTTEERALIETHTIEGERDARAGRRPARRRRRASSAPATSAGTARGYPDGLAGEEIPLVARIVCCCDAFNAMTTDRSYRAALPAEAAIAELRRERGHAVRPGAAPRARRSGRPAVPRARNRCSPPLSGEPQWRRATAGSLPVHGRVTPRHQRSGQRLYPPTTSTRRPGRDPSRGDPLRAPGGSSEEACAGTRPRWLRRRRGGRRRASSPCADGRRPARPRQRRGPDRADREDRRPAAG